MFEVQAAQLASVKATDPSVKSFAGMLVGPHTAANNELVQLANSKKVELPAAPPRAMRREIEKLGKLHRQRVRPGIRAQVGIKAHEKDIKKFEKASKDVKDAELKAWIDKTLPALRQHLAQAQKLPQAGKDRPRMGKRTVDVRGGLSYTANRVASDMPAQLPCPRLTLPAIDWTGALRGNPHEMRQRLPRSRRGGHGVDRSDGGKRNQAGARTPAIFRGGRGRQHQAGVG